MPRKEERSNEQPVAAGVPVDSPHPALKLRHTLRGHSRSICGMALSPDGRILASTSRDGTVRLWDCETGAAVHCLTGHSGGVISAAWSRDGELLASGGDHNDKTVRLWNPQTGALQQEALRGHTDSIHIIAWRD